VFDDLYFDYLVSVGLVLSYLWFIILLVFSSGVASNISQCQITLICAIARARSRKVLCATVYLFNIYFFGYG